MANQQVEFDAYQEALSIVKTRAHFGDFRCPSMKPRYLLKECYDKLLAIKECTDKP